jgi:hypothetical protein
MIRYRRPPDSQQAQDVISNVYAWRCFDPRVCDESAQID